MGERDSGSVEARGSPCPSCRPGWCRPYRIPLDIVLTRLRLSKPIALPRSELIIPYVESLIPDTPFYGRPERSWSPETGCTSSERPGASASARTGSCRDRLTAPLPGDDAEEEEGIVTDRTLAPGSDIARGAAASSTVGFQPPVTIRGCVLGKSARRSGDGWATSGQPPGFGRSAAGPYLPRSCDRSPRFRGRGSRYLLLGSGASSSLRS